MSDKLLKLVKRLRDAALDLYHEPVRSHVPVDRSDLKEIVEDWSRLVSENLTERLEIARLKAEIEAIRKDKSEPCDGCFMADAETLRKDAARLNWLDGRFRPVVEGQCMASPEGELTGYDWGVFGQCSTVREAIDDAMSMENKS